jgi:hypothetical protein
VRGPNVRYPLRDLGRHISISFFWNVVWESPGTLSLS